MFHAVHYFDRILTPFKNKECFKIDRHLHISQLANTSGPTHLDIQIYALFHFNLETDVTVFFRIKLQTGWSQDQVPHKWDLILAPACLQTYKSTEEYETVKMKKNPNPNRLQTVRSRSNSACKRRLYNDVI